MSHGCNAVGCGPHGKAVSQYDDLAMKRLVTEFARRVRDAVEAPTKAVEGPRRAYGHTRSTPDAADGLAPVRAMQ